MACPVCFGDSNEPMALAAAGVASTTRISESGAGGAGTADRSALPDTVYTKLGIHSRAELGSRMALPDPRTDVDGGDHRSG